MAGYFSRRNSETLFSELINSVDEEYKLILVIHKELIFSLLIMQFQ
jgi:hypothetical protein